MEAPSLEQLRGGEIHPIRERFFCGVKIFVDLRGRVRPPTIAAGASPPAQPRRQSNGRICSFMAYLVCVHLRSMVASVVFTRWSD